MNNKKRLHPPRIAGWILNRTISSDIQYSAMGDFEEIYLKKRKKSGAFSANFWYWKQVVCSFPDFLKSSLLWKLSILRNYLVISLRNIIKQKVFSAINILGLSLGITCCILILLFTMDELTYDRFHENSGSIYPVLYENHFLKTKGESLPLPMGQALKAFFPEVKRFVRLNEREAVVRYKDRIFNERITFSDPDFFNLFTFPLISGNNNLSDNTIFLTQNIAIKYFGEEDPAGKTLFLNFDSKIKEFFIGGVIKKPPGNSSIRFDFIINLQNLNFLEHPGFTNEWGLFRTALFLQVEDKRSIPGIESRFPLFIRENMQEYLLRTRELGRWGDRKLPITLSLSNIKDLHLYSGIHYRGKILNSLVLILIAVIVLVIACINFNNLSIGKASVRSLEIGMRKVLGAGRKQLIGQFWSESIIMAAISMITGFVFASLLLPEFNSFSGKNMHLANIITPLNAIILVSLVLLIGIISGSYPALVLSGLKPVEIIKGKFRLKGKNSIARYLIVMQFSLSVILIICTMVLSRQLKFMNSQYIGFKKEGIVVVRTQTDSPPVSRKIIENFKDTVKNYSSVINITGSSTSFSSLVTISINEMNGKNIPVYISTVYYNYLTTTDMELIEGRDFSEKFPTDTSAVIVNRKYVEEMDIESPIGKTVRIGLNPPMHIIGVIKDINFFSLKQDTGPLAFNLLPKRPLRVILVRISESNVFETIKLLRKTWSHIQPGKPFEYTFLDSDIASQYDNDKKWNGIVMYSSFLAILISSMGIFGLTLITVNQKVKEIGIRKVLGAGVSRIMGMVLKEFIYLVLIANAIAWPAAFLLMNKYLENFHYRISPEPQIFILAGSISVTVAVLTISCLAVKAALTNPVKALKHE